MSEHGEQSDNVTPNASLTMPAPLPMVCTFVMYREGTGPETGGKVFDPYGFSSSSFASDETLCWFRAAELKHGRVAMVRNTDRQCLARA